MIIDRIENASRYYALGSGIAEALEFIKDNNFHEIELGHYEINKDKVNMILKEFEQNCTDRIRMEAHRRNIDVHYWVNGSEMMGYAPLQTQSVLEPYHEEKDYGFYAGDASFSRLEPGMFAIYFPTDLHTALADEQCNSKVKKVVFKVVID